MIRTWPFLLIAIVGCVSAADVAATRFKENPLLTVDSAPSIGDNINGPSVIRVPDWVPNPLGRYYMYFAHHKGQHIRMAYADSLHGPWKVYEPGVLQASETSFYRPQPDPDPSPYGVYTHIASPEVIVDTERKRIVMWFHGMFTAGQKWPDNLQEANAWIRANNYGQFTQAAESSDGIHFTAGPAISRQSYLRVFAQGGQLYGMSRLGQLMRGKDAASVFELGPNPFRETPYSNKVRHVALWPHDGVLEIIFSYIGDAPESIYHTTMALSGEWTQWRIGTVEKVLIPEAAYECPKLPVAPSEVGEIYGPARQLRDPALFVENGQFTLFYTNCGEQGISAADVRFSK